MSLGLVFLSEVCGTGMLTLLGCGVVANVALKGTKGNNGGFLMVTWGWGIAVFAGVYVAAGSGCPPQPRRYPWLPGKRQCGVRPRCCR
jgi:glycerol uptake facilitator protein